MIIIIILSLSPAVSMILTVVSLILNHEAIHLFDDTIINTTGATEKVLTVNTPNEVIFKKK